ncbi:MAG: YHS domain-containing protein [Actinomycetota bacterium]|nr:YHS domain-containing protein [Actinomycetota bacterium]
MAGYDPVCGMTIEEDDAADSSEYQGHDYYFCSTTCKERFDGDPEAYLP